MRAFPQTQMPKGNAKGNAKINILDEIRKNRNNCLELVKKFEKLNVNNDDVQRAISKSGWLPLHYAMVFCKGEGVLELVQFLVRRHPKCVQEKTTDRGTLAINLMPPTTNPQPVIEAMQRDQMQARLYIMKKYPEGVSMEDKDGETPIVRAVVGRCNLIVQQIVENFPDLASKPNGKGRLPLHYAIESGNAGAVRILYSAYPGGIAVKDGAGATPAQLLAFLPDKDAILASLAAVVSDVFDIASESETTGSDTFNSRHHMMPQFLNENNISIWSNPVVWYLVKNRVSSIITIPSHTEVRQELRKDATFDLQRNSKIEVAEYLKDDNDISHSSPALKLKKEARLSEGKFKRFTKKGQFEALRQSFETAKTLKC